MLFSRRQLLTVFRVMAVMFVIAGMMVSPLLASGGKCCCGGEDTKFAGAEMGCCKGMTGGDSQDSKTPHKPCPGQCSHCLCSGYAPLRVMDADKGAVVDMVREAWVGVRVEGLVGVVVSPVADILRPPRG